ncbi:hypothetical protein [Niastella sp. OAS944]|uniref:hypothetical protein n=1 Tax=Niastella sp. OAS944 TaxID=2664089 RepID=UPI0034937148|nr:hypothetical protein [Chitinophagaceae bacterium OAS944]
MGVSFIGIASKINEEKLLAAIQHTFQVMNINKSIVFNSEQPFEAIVLRKGKDNIVDIYSGNLGTICTVSWNVYDRYLFKDIISGFFNLLYFDISETSMSHRFAWFSEGDEKHYTNISYKEDIMYISGPNFLNIKNTDDIFTGTFANAVKEYLPQSFGAMLVSEEKIKRYEVI